MTRRRILGGILALLWLLRWKWGSKTNLRGLLGLILRLRLMLWRLLRWKWGGGMNLMGLLRLILRLLNLRRLLILLLLRVNLLRLLILRWMLGLNLSFRLPHTCPRDFGGSAIHSVLPFYRRRFGFMLATARFGAGFQTSGLPGFRISGKTFPGHWFLIWGRAPCFQLNFPFLFHKVSPFYQIQ